MSSGPYNNNNRGTPGNGGGRGKRRSKGKNRNPLHAYASEHGGQASGEMAPQYREAPNTSLPPQQAFSPSVQKLFDSIENPVNLQITVTGENRHVSESEFTSAEPAPNPAAKHQHTTPSPGGCQSGQVQGDGGYMVSDKVTATEEAWPTLGDSLAISPKKSDADSFNQKFKRDRKKSKKGKQKNGVNIPPDKAVGSVEPTADQLTTQINNMAINEPTDTKSTAGSKTKPTQSGGHASDTQANKKAGQTTDVQVKKETKPTQSGGHASDTQANKKAGQTTDVQVKKETKANKKTSKDREPQANKETPSKKAAAPKEVPRAAEEVKHSQAAVSANVETAKTREIQKETPVSNRPEKTTPKSDFTSSTQNTSSAEKSSPATPGSEGTDSGKRERKKVNVYVQFLEEYRSKVGNKYIQALDDDFIRPLAKKSAKFPKAFFYCRLCEFHMDTAEAMETHRTSEDGHLRRKRIKTGDELLRSMPPQTKTHMQVLSTYLDQVYAGVVLPEQEANDRKATVDQLEKDLHEHRDSLKCVRLQVCGSVRAGFALKGSNTNVRIIAPKTANLAQMMVDILSIVSSLESKYKAVEHQFDARDPYISFTVDGISGAFQLQFTEDSFYMANMLYSCYSRWHPKLKQLAVLFKYLAKISHLSDVSSGALAPYCFPLMAIFYCQQSSLAPVYFQTVDLETKTEAEFQADIDSLDLTQPQCQQRIEAKPISELWLKLLQFYSLNFKQESYVVSVINCKLVQKEEKAWGSKRLAIEDPALPKRNLCKTVSHQRVFDFISDVIRKACRYFAIPQLQSGPAFTMILENEPSVGQKVNSSAVDRPDGMKSKKAAENSQAIERGPEDVVPDAPNAVTADGEKTSQSAVDKKEPSPEVSTPLTTAANGVAKAETVSSSANSEDDLYDKEMVEKLSAHDIQFDFKSKHLAVSDLKLPIFCRMCSKPNHTSDNCPEEQLPPCVPLPPPSAQHRSLLSNLLEQIKEQTQLMPEEVQVREQLLNELARRIQHQFPEVKLTLYGSSRNGFGSTGSDLDICMTFNGTDELTIEETRSTIKTVGKLLRGVDHLTDIITLTTAKVPIVKFYSEKYKLEADVSLYNILAQRNTKMLFRYSQVDERVRTLGYCVKEFAKNCDIGDASRGSLSSYAYVIMLIYYLQQCDPPVLPVLQELYTGDTVPEEKVEGWNTWYFSGDNRQLAKMWPGYRKNTCDVAQLWLGFLDFYSQKFQYKSYVVSIRKKRLMTKFEKLWNSDTLAIEDPFDLKRNLGAALSKKMNAYILTTFIKARSVFHTSSEERNEVPEGKRKSMYNFYFKHKDIVSVDGPPSNNRTCNFCGQIGHFIKACPVKSDRARQLKEMRKQKKEKAEMRNREVLQLSAGEYQQVPIVDQYRPMSAQQRQRGSPNKQPKSAGSRRAGPPNLSYRPQAAFPPPAAYNSQVAMNNAQLHIARMAMQAAMPVNPPLYHQGGQSMPMVIMNSSLQDNRHNPVPQHRPQLPHQ